MSSGRHLIWILGPVLMVLTWFMFWGDLGVEPARSVRNLWNTGHIFYFALVAYLLMKSQFIARQSPAVQWLIILSMTLLTGWLIEVAQYYGTQRTPDSGDILRDLIGSLLVLAFTSSQHHAKAIPWTLLSKIAALSLLLIQLIPLMISLVDEAIAREQFPVLANFSTPFEMGRWSGGAERFRESPAGLSAVGFMKVNLTTQRHSGISLKYFPGDWRGFHTLSLQIYNPDAEAVSVTCRIHDRLHAIGRQNYTDRFNYAYLLQPGFNDIEIELDKVTASPKGRSMDLSRIHRLGIFASELAEPRTLYIQEVRLE